MANEKLHGWGVRSSPDVQKAGEYRCPECDRDYPVGLGLYKIIVGFACDEPWQMKHHDDFGTALGIMILECPRCFAKGWIHLYEPSFALAKRCCPLWPK